MTLTKQYVVALCGLVLSVIVIGPKVRGLIHTWLRTVGF